MCVQRHGEVGCVGLARLRCDFCDIGVRCAAARRIARSHREAPSAIGVGRGRAQHGGAFFDGDHRKRAGRAHQGRSGVIGHAAIGHVARHAACVVQHFVNAHQHCAGVYRDDHRCAGQTGVARGVGGRGGDAVTAVAQRGGRGHAPGAVGAHGGGADHRAGGAAVGHGDGLARRAGAGEGRCPVIGAAAWGNRACLRGHVVRERWCAWRSRPCRIQGNRVHATGWAGDPVLAHHRCQFVRALVGQRGGGQGPLSVGVYRGGA